MRILALMTDAFGSGGGIAQYNRDFLTAVSAVGEVETVQVLVRHGAERHLQISEKLRQESARGNKLRFLWRSQRLARTLRAGDWIFCGHLNLVRLAALLCKRSGAKLWLQLHGIEAWERPSRAMRIAAERANLVTSVSRFTRRQFLGWARFEPTRIKVLANTFDPVFSPGPKPQSLIERYGLQHKRVLLTVSRLSSAERYKGHDRILSALPNLLRTHPDLIYLVAGEGDDRPRLERIARELGVESSVRFLGYVADDELPKLYRLADVFVMPSTGEGFGIVYLEAIASGVPVVACDGDGSADPLRDGLAGTLVPSNDSAVLIRAIESRLDAQPPSVVGIDCFTYSPFADNVLMIVSSIAKPPTRLT